MIEHEYFLNLAFDEAKQGVSTYAGGPFGAVIVKENNVIASAHNTVTSSNDPTAHAEINAIRQACEHLGTYELENCVLYTSCEPCPMCLGAIYWAHLDRVYFSATRSDAAASGFDDSFIYEEISRDIRNRKIPMIQIDCDESSGCFDAWKTLANRKHY